MLWELQCCQSRTGDPLCSGALWAGGRASTLPEGVWFLFKDKVTRRGKTHISKTFRMVILGRYSHRDHYLSLLSSSLPTHFLALTKFSFLLQTREWKSKPKKTWRFFQHVQNNAYSLPLEFYLIFFSEHFTRFPKEMLSCYLSLTSHLINLVSTKNKRDVLAIVKILLVLLKRVRRDSLDYCLQWGKIVRRSFCHML